MLLALPAADPWLPWYALLLMLLMLLLLLLQAKRQQVQSELEAKTAKKRAKRQKKKVRGAVCSNKVALAPDSVGSLLLRGCKQRPVHMQGTLQYAGAASSCVMRCIIFIAGYHCSSRPGASQA
jgi:hypothetical protein